VKNAALQIHQFVPTLILIAGGIALVCGIALYVARRRAAVNAAGVEVGGGGRLFALNRVFRVALWSAAGLGLLQALLGIVLLTQGCSPRESLHYVYGLIVLGAVPVAYVYSDQKDVRRDIIIMSIAAAAVIGAAIRGLATGPGGVC
jgi:heme A synthase